MDTARATGARIRLTVAPSTARARPGDHVAFALTVRNSGDAPDRYRLDIVGLQRLWYELADTRVALAPDESATVTLMVRPVDSAAFVAGRYPFRVRVTSDEAAAVQASVTVDFAVGADATSDATSGATSGPAATSESPRRASSSGGARPASASVATPPSPRRAPMRGASPASAPSVGDPTPAVIPIRPQRAPIRGAILPAAAPARDARPAPVTAPTPGAAAEPAGVPAPAVTSDAAAVSAPVTVPRPAIAPELAAAPEPAVVPKPDTPPESVVAVAPAAIAAPATHDALPVDTPASRRIPTWAALPVLVVLLAAAAVLTLHAAGAGPFAPRQPAAPAAHPPLAPVDTPRGRVKGLVARAPSIASFVLVKGRGGQPDKLVWDTRRVAQVTLDGVPVPAHGTRLLRGAVAGASYRLDARAGARRITARVRVPAGGAARPASAAPVALFNMNAADFGARALRAAGAGAERTIRIVNLGPGLLTVASVGLGGQDPQDFSVRTTCANSSLTVDGGCAIYVAFNPTGRGARAADLIVADNTAASPRIIEVTGRGA